MDEIGRGTSTFDGLALAAGIAAHLHDRSKAFTLFATHYFELTGFPATHHCAVNMHVSATSKSGRDIVFLHEVQPGPASKQLWHSGGAAGRHARVPWSGMRDRPSKHSKHSRRRPVRRSTCSPPMPLAEAPMETSAVESALASLDPDTMSPREALDALYSLKKLHKLHHE